MDRRNVFVWAGCVRCSHDRLGEWGSCIDAGASSGSGEGRATAAAVSRVQHPVAAAAERDDEASICRGRLRIDAAMGLQLCANSAVVLDLGKADGLDVHR